MSASMAVIGFLLGSGLFMLGAFLFWRAVRADNVTAIIGSILPSLMLLIWMVILGKQELAVSVICGVVSINLVLLGLFVLCGRICLEPETGRLTMGWLGCVLLVLIIAGRHGQVGRFGTLGLLIVALVVIYQIVSQFKKQKQSKAKTIPWWLIVLGVGLSLFGANLVVTQSEVFAVMLGLPTGIFGQLIIAPLAGLWVVFGLRRRGDWQLKQISTGLLWGNVILVTSGLGLLGLCFGGLCLTQELSCVTLPLIGLMILLTNLMVYLPQKTARLWGGLILVLYGVFLIILLR